MYGHISYMIVHGYDYLYVYTYLYSCIKNFLPGNISTPIGSLS